MDDLLSEFLTETAESIEVVDVQLIELEEDPNNEEVLANIFRLVHTIKGTCGFLGLPRLERVAHAGENVLGQFRDGVISVTPEAISVILASLDQIKEILEKLEATGEEPAGNDNDLIARLDAIVTGGSAPAAEVVAAEPEPKPEEDLRPGEVSIEELEAAFLAAPGPDDEPEPAVELADDLFEQAGGEDSISVAAHLCAGRICKNSELATYFDADMTAKFQGLFDTAFKGQEDSVAVIAGTIVVNPGFQNQHFDEFLEVVKAAFEEVRMDLDVCRMAVAAVETARPHMIAKSQELAATQSDDKDKPAAKSKEGGRVTQSIRVNVDLLENLMNMVSELVLTRNQLMQMVRDLDDSEFAVPLQRLSQCTTELQESVMKTRMQPIGNAWAQLPRIVRDLALELDKKIELKMIGAETELDRQVLELIKDPLTHMVRNSADHGIEPKAERRAKGKKEKGTIRLNAYHEGGHIIIEISDDGRGLATEKLRAKAIERGLVDAAAAAELTDAQVHRFIFHAGFSTAKKVTNVSGRGVGMDVVRSNVEKIGGTIDLKSIEGKGTSCFIKIPLTLAIVSAMIVQAGPDRFAIPQISVLELVRASAHSEYKIEQIKNTPVLRLRDKLLPLVYLNQILEFSSKEECDDTSGQSEAFVVVTQVGSFTFGIVVDQVFDTEEIVVKPLSPILKGLNIYSGNTILGDGNVIMILDPNGIAATANASVTGGQDDMMDRGDASAASDDIEAMLVFKAGGEGQKAVPLALVARLEDIDIERIEEADGRYLVQYRGSLMPLVRVNDRCNFKKGKRQQVLVFADGEQTMGLAVDEILDIVEDELNVEINSDTPGVIGSAVLSEKATEIIDVAHYLSLAFCDRRWSRDSQPAPAPLKGTTVLLIDDSAFFRNMLKPVLEGVGYEVTSVSTAEEALDLREEGRGFKLIISDIEMPGMTGLELAEEIKSKEGPWRETPLVALSNHAAESEVNRGRDAGFDDYVAKFDRDALLVSLSQQLKLRGDAA